MEYLLIAGGVGMFIGFSLGMFFMALIKASDADTLLAPPTRAYPHQERLVAQESTKAA